MELSLSWHQAAL